MDGSSEFCKCIIICAKNIGGNPKKKTFLSFIIGYSTNFITYCCIEFTSPRTGFELEILVVIGTNCTGSRGRDRMVVGCMTTFRH